jgi:quercetin dioxygenase-like cupin family protein
MTYRNLAIGLVAALMSTTAAGQQSLTIYASKVEWKPVSIPGVPAGLMVRSLHEDPANNRASSLVRYPKGFNEPKHYHKGCVHTIYILRGKLKAPQGELGPGTFLYAATGEPHGPFTALEETEILFHVDGPFDYIIAK